jgi:uncharacterized protein (UPF0303 family)
MALPLAEAISTDPLDPTPYTLYSMTPAELAAHLALQEQTLTLPHFDATTAWTLGTMLHELAVTRAHSLVIDIRRFGRPHQPLFYAALPGTTPDNARWARRKSNVVARYHRSSYAIGLRLEQQGQTITQRHALPASRYATVGGALPIEVPAAGGVVGAITVSGLTSHDDHELIVEALCRHLGRDYAELRLPKI